MSEPHEGVSVLSKAEGKFAAQALNGAAVIFGSDTEYGRILLRVADALGGKQIDIVEDAQ
jgi:hypothetical protein